MKNTVTTADVRHIAELSKLSFTDAECEEMRANLQKQVANFEILDSVDISDVPPTAHIIQAVNVLRDDVVRPSFANASLLAGAPDKSGDVGEEAYVVPRVVD